MSEPSQIKDLKRRSNKKASIKSAKRRKEDSENVQFVIRKGEAFRKRTRENFCLPLTIYDPLISARRMCEEARAYLKSKNLNVVSLDKEGQTLKIDGVYFKVPGSVGMMGLDGSAVHELIRWLRELLASEGQNPSSRISSNLSDIRRCHDFTIV